jgi:hypothetical protein
MIVNGARAATGNSAYCGARATTNQCANRGATGRAYSDALDRLTDMMTTSIDRVMCRMMPRIIGSVRERSRCEAR